MRDDFPKPVAEALAKRVGYRCSNPGCRRVTSGPHTVASKSINVGVAAHITAASPGGPRHDKSLTPEERKSAENGIWLCQKCAKMVDSDEARYDTPLLLQWKDVAEREALREIETAGAGKGPSDIDALKEYRAYFDRPALQDALRVCGSFKKFSGALDDLVSLLNTGDVQGQAVTKRRADFDREDWRASLESLYHAIRELRGQYTSLVKAGEINEQKCTCEFRRHAQHGEFEGMKHRVIGILNGVLAEANLPEIRGGC
jgi:hypothetical protein